jgi:hypothetical protein
MLPEVLAMLAKRTVRVNVDSEYVPPICIS